MTGYMFFIFPVNAQKNWKNRTIYTAIHCETLYQTYYFNINDSVSKNSNFFKNKLITYNKL